MQTENFYVDDSVKNNTYYKKKYDDTNVYEFFLMSRSKRVAMVKIKITDEEVTPIRIKVFDKENLPFVFRGIQIPETLIDTNEADEQYRELLNIFKEWLHSRRIPKERVNIDHILKSIFGFNNEFEKYYSKERIDTLLDFLVIFSYARNMTDKFWLNPVSGIKYGYNSNKDKDLYDSLELAPSKNVFPLLGINVSTDDISLRRHADYTGLDLTKNGFTKAYYNIVLKKEPYITNHIQFNCPDFCTNGIVTKRWARINNTNYLEKYYENNEDLQKALQVATKCRKLYPEIFAKPYAIKDENDVIVGYKTKCLTDGYTELITLKDICLINNPSREISENKLYENLEQLGLSEYKETINNLKETNLINIFENVGFIIDCNSKEIQDLKAWA